MLVLRIKLSERAMATDMVFVIMILQRSLKSRLKNIFLHNSYRKFAFRCLKNEAKEADVMLRVER